MSERKTTEIKLRVTPAEKAAWQLAAEEEGVGLSELIRREVNAKALQHEEGDPEMVSVMNNPLSPQVLAALATRGVGFPAWSPTAATKNVGTSGKADSVAKPWMFEARDA